MPSRTAQDDHAARKQIPTLPLEVLDRIVQYSDFETAKALTLTPESLAESARAVVWQGFLLQTGYVRTAGSSETRRS